MPGRVMKVDPETEMEIDSGGFPKVIPWGSLPPYLTVKQVAAHIIPKTVKTLRHWIHIDAEGFDTECCTRRAGGVYIIKDNLKRWMDHGQRERTLGRR